MGSKVPELTDEEISKLSDEKLVEHAESVLLKEFREPDHGHLTASRIFALARKGLELEKLKTVTENLVSCFETNCEVAMIPVRSFPDYTDAKNALEALDRTPTPTPAVVTPS